ncbi:cytochrome c biogenesis protein DipZ [Caballeronia ptereochthonis]|uniref:Cytochrome c biogenesis protein transmembrane region n=1 Tax=Caballeronia ptereochthonis TaxID=1777144 RepID=A0A158BDN8_9BURK|nr:cytochrome c biogenesis protein DipZ [Caballeronia ptereochthonis]SAK67477.1 cytochrome c biogenesis protein transmembrane region [Caballeronia ptereochthonis]
MSFIVIAFLGGVFTVLSPCILPVVPFVFARSDRPFLTDRLPLFAGLAGTFALVTGIGAAGLAGAAQLSQYGRWIALAMLALFGAALLFPSIAARLTLPLSGLADRITARSQSYGTTRRIASSMLLGAATGLLWAPCAGPILGVILTGAALHGANWQTAAALAAYAVGAVSSLAVATGLGKRAFDALKRSLGFGEHLRRAMGALVLLSVAAIATGFDTRLLAHVPGAPTNGIEGWLVDVAKTKQASHEERQGARVVRVSMPVALPVQGRLPSLDGATAWLNSAPLSADALRGKVVVVNFWTYSCINCLRTLPYLKTWAQRYGNDGLVVVGVHTPEFGFERDTGNVKRALENLTIRYPVAIDNDYGIWRAFGNQYWPAFYIVDAQGRVRYHHFGEGGYREAEDAIRQLLAENGKPMMSADAQPVQGSGAQAAADTADIGSDETYVGYRQAQGFASPQRVKPDAAENYTLPAQLPLNQWALDGKWNVGGEAAVPAASRAHIAYHFHARDLHLVLGPTTDGKPVRFRITIDGKPPGASHGADVAADGSGIVTNARLYQLVRQNDAVDDRTFQIEFLDPGAQVYSFTFG